MRNHRLLLGFFFFLFIPYTVSTAHAKMIDVQVTKEEGPVDIEADHLVYERETQTYQAHGHVEVKRGNLTLNADHAQLNTTTKELTAWGNVVLREGEDLLECERLEVNVDTRLGKVFQAKLFLKEQNFHLTGKEVEKLGENRYRIREGAFSTCDAKRPDWKFSVKELDVTLEGTGIAKGPVFYLEDIPVLYLPVSLFPVRRERQTGFILPDVGYSDQYGLQVKAAFFWAIRKDMDATGYLDWQGERGPKGGLEYRYAFTKDTHGQANFYFIDDQVYEGNRYAFFVQHQQKFPYDLYLKANVNYVSDRFYTQDFDEDLPEGAKIDSRSLRLLRSNLFGGKNWDQFSFLANGGFYEDLTQDSNDRTVQLLPVVQFTAQPQSLLKTPLFYEVTSSYTNFFREEGLEANRLDLFPQVSFPFRLFNVLKLNPNVGFRETVYYSYNDPTNRLKGWESRETFEANMEMATELYRVYDGAVSPWFSNFFKVAKWMHTIEPTVGYHYSPRVNQDALPVFDQLDQIPYMNEITYGFTQRLVGKPSKEGVESGPYEYAKLRIVQGYSLGDPYERDEKGKGRYFSNIRGELWWNFKPNLTAHLDTGFNPYQGNFDWFNALLRAKDERNDALLLQYRYTRDNIQEINVYGRVKTIPPLYLYGGIRYNIFDRTRVESIYGAEYQAQCWSLSFMVEDINDSPDGTQKKELKFKLFVNLLGLGSLGHKPYFSKF